MDKLALLGPAYHGYKSELLNVIRETGKVWSGWTYFHPDEKEELLREQFERDRYFHIYVHDTKNPSRSVIERHGARPGSGLVEYRLYVTKFEYEHHVRSSPNPVLSIPYTEPEESCGWYLVEEVDNKITSRHWSSFIDFQTRTNVQEFRMYWPNLPWIYILDPLKC